MKKLPPHVESPKVDLYIDGQTVDFGAAFVVVVVATKRRFDSFIHPSYFHHRSFQLGEIIRSFSN
jgi:hypothetical protein